MSLNRSTTNGLKYPQYEQWLTPYVTEQKYNEWIEELKNVFENSPDWSYWEQWCSVMICILTAGVVSCPCFYIQHLGRSFKRVVQDAFHKVSGDGVQMKFVKFPRYENGQWIDSKGQTLMLRSVGGSGRYPRPGGPPLGFNIIISLPSAIEWPPTVSYAQPPVG